jgi:hypothetical protein
MGRVDVDGSDRLEFLGANGHADRPHFTGGPHSEQCLPW